MLKNVLKSHYLLLPPGKCLPKLLDNPEYSYVEVMATHSPKNKTKQKNKTKGRTKIKKKFFIIRVNFLFRPRTFHHYCAYIILHSPIQSIIIKSMLSFDLLLCVCVWPSHLFLSSFCETNAKNYVYRCYTRSCIHAHCVVDLAPEASGRNKKEKRVMEKKIAKVPKIFADTRILGNLTINWLLEMSEKKQKICPNHSPKFAKFN